MVKCEFFPKLNMSIVYSKQYGSKKFNSVTNARPLFPLLFITSFDFLYIYTFSMLGVGGSFFNCRLFGSGSQH